MALFCTAQATRPEFLSITKYILLSCQTACRTLNRLKECTEQPGITYDIPGDVIDDRYLKTTRIFGTVIHANGRLGRCQT